MKKAICLFVIFIAITSFKNNNEENQDVTYLTVSMVKNALNGDLGKIGAQITLSPDIYDLMIESTTAKYGTNQSPWAGVFLYTHEIFGDGQPSPNFMTCLNGIGKVKTIDLSNNNDNITLQGFMVPNVPTYDDSGEVIVKVIRKRDNKISFLTVSMVNNALKGDIGKIGAQVTLSPGKYQFQIESTTAKFGTNQSPWAGVFLYTHEIFGDARPSQNFMTSLNGIGIVKTIDLSNNNENITIQGFMIPNIPTYDDSGEVKIKITRL